MIDNINIPLFETPGIHSAQSMAKDSFHNW